MDRGQAPETPPGETPVIPSGAPPLQPSQTEGPQEQPAASGWYWCPEHLLAAEQPGTCAVCGKPYQAAPAGGMPATPYRPIHRGVRKTLRERVTVAVGLVAAVAALGGAATGVVFLYRGGTQLDSNGLPVQPAAASAQSNASTATDSSTGTTPIPLKTFQNHTVTLSGQWTTTRSVITSMTNIAQFFATGTTPPPLDIAARHNKTTIAAYTITSTTPDSDINFFSGSGGGSGATSSGGNYTLTNGAPMTIAGRTAMAFDFQQTNSAGSLLVHIHFYIVSAVDHIALIEIGTTDATGGDLSTAEKAVEGL
ncbi:MAG TPA: hypothetical protein VGQ42_17810 [Candidatus Dormibacteraeota bacterium]|nr:hypothetical protein [Candidatus Dormibacteraeota bacterium]